LRIDYLHLELIRGAIGNTLIPGIGIDYNGTISALAGSNTHRYVRYIVGFYIALLDAKGAKVSRGSA